MQKTETAARRPMTLELEPEPAPPPSAAPLATTGEARSPSAPAPAPAAPAPSATPFTLPPGLSPVDRFAALIAGGVTPDMLQRYLDVQRQYEAEEARRQYVAAMAAFKTEPLAKIRKKKHVTQKLRDKHTREVKGEISYSHETLDEVVRAVVAPMAKHGLSHAWRTHQDRQTSVVTVRCTITHKGGHSESVELWGMPDDTGSKNEIQKVASTVRYLQRYTLELITGVAAEDDFSENDGRGGGGDDETPKRAAPRPRPAEGGGARSPSGGPRRATAKQVDVITARLEEFTIPSAEFCAAFSIAQVHELPFDAVDDAFTWIRNYGPTP